MSAYAALLEDLENAAAFEPVTASAEASDLNERVAAGWAKALPLEERLAAKYEQAGRGLARRARRRYERAQPVIAAARPPNWLPQPDELVTPEDTAAAAARTQAARRAIVQAMVGSILGIEASRDAVFRALIEVQAGRQAERLVEGSRDAVARVILDAQVEGWGVPETAEAIQTELETVAGWQSVMLARTDLISLSNASSVASASLLGADAPPYKVWLATSDNRTRPDHHEAEGQTVPVEQPFTVGGEALAYPGDPAGSDGNTINCRCTVRYAWAPNPGFAPNAISAAFSPSQPRYQVGVREGGRWRPESGEGTLDDLAARHPDVEVWASDHGDGITLHMIRTKPGARGTGAASRALRDLTAMADRRGVPMWLTPEAVGDDAPMSTDQLARWYRRHGWRDTSSRKMGDLEHTGLMIREPTRSLVAAYVEQQHPRDPGGEDGGQWVSVRSFADDLREMSAEQLFAAAAAHNNKSRAWREFSDEWDVGEYTLTDAEGMRALGRDPYTSGYYQPETDKVFISATLAEKMLEGYRSGALGQRELLGRTVPGQGLITNDHILRHELAHQAWARMAPAQREEFIARMPVNSELSRLTKYAGGAEEYYDGAVFGKGVFPWQGEVFAEIAAVTLQPGYRPSQWPAWVRDYGDWLRAQRRPA